jgi:hypothetical protein
MKTIEMLTLWKKAVIVRRRGRYRRGMVEALCESCATLVAVIARVNSA